MQQKTPQIPAVAWACELIQYWNLLSLSRIIISVCLGNGKKWGRKQHRICFCFRRLFGAPLISPPSRLVLRNNSTAQFPSNSVEFSRLGRRSAKKNKKKQGGLFDTAALHTLIRSTSVCARVCAAGITLQIIYSVASQHFDLHFLHFNHSPICSSRCTAVLALQLNSERTRIHLNSLKRRLS